MLWLVLGELVVALRAGGVLILVCDFVIFWVWGDCAGYLWFWGGACSWFVSFWGGLTEVSGLMWGWYNIGFGV